jgi:hypothetical protein
VKGDPHMHTRQPTGVPARNGLLASALALGMALLVTTACQPKAIVEVKAPSEPITINLNVKIEHEIRVKVDKDLDQLFENEDLF